MRPRPKPLLRPRSIVLAAVALVALGALGVAGCQTKRAKDPKVPPGARQAIFAGGCFWCMQPAFDAVPGVVATRVGYTGGSEKNPTYRQVASGATGHVEAIAVWYLPQRVSYARLLGVFWRNIDPTDDGGQFADRGAQYRPIIFYANEKERQAAVASRQALAASKRFPRRITVPVRRAGRFYNAEVSHQDYYKKHPARYRSYKWRSGRGPFLQRVWSR